MKGKSGKKIVKQKRKIHEGSPRKKVSGNLSVTNKKTQTKF